MSRHQWAADRLWEGVVGGANKPWRAGLDVLVATPLPYSSLTDAPALAAQLQALAHTAIDEQIDLTDPVSERARMYGEMLVTCAGCHRSLDVARRTR